MRVLGVDLGEAHVGLAISDPDGVLAQPLSVVPAREDVLWSRLEAYIKEYGVGDVVVGLPLNMNGTRGPQAERAELFARELAIRFHVPVHLYDERLTTRVAEQALIESGVSRRRRRDVVDKVSAVLILQGYLDRRGSAAKN